MQSLSDERVQDDLDTQIAKNVLGKIQDLEILVVQKRVGYEYCTVSIELILSEVEDLQGRIFTEHLTEHPCILKTQHVIRQTEHLDVLELSSLNGTSHEVWTLVYQFVSLQLCRVKYCLLTSFQYVKLRIAGKLSQHGSISLCIGFDFSLEDASHLV